MAASNGAKSRNKKSPQSQGAKNPAKTKQSFLSLKVATLLVCILGISVSVFALYIEILKEKDPNYVALCDINSHMSCSRVLTSRWSKGFGLVEKILSKDSILNQPNPVFGIIFYILHATLALKTSLSMAVVQFGMSILSNIGTIYLGYILIYILEDLCLVCVTMYVINFTLLLLNFFTLRNAISGEVKMQKKKKK